MIPKIIHRVIPPKTNPLMDFCWDKVLEFTPDWEHRTNYDQGDYPIVGKALPYCPSGAFRADLIRLEQVYLHGGIYLDSDVQLLKPIDDFLKYDAFCVLEEDNIVGNQVFGATPKHPAIMAAIEFALGHLDMLRQSGGFISNPTYSSVAWGPWVHSETFGKYKYISLLPKHLFNPFHMTDVLAPKVQKALPHWRPLKSDNPKLITELNPFTYGVHLFNWSWVEGSTWSDRSKE